MAAGASGLGIVSRAARHDDHRRGDDTGSPVLAESPIGSRMFGA